jgi:hypothetical protein
MKTRENLATVETRDPRNFVGGLAATLSLAALLASPAVQAADPIQIGFGMALTGGLAANGKSALVAMQIWQSDVNAKDGLLGTPSTRSASRRSCAAAAWSGCNRRRSRPSSV